MAGGPAPTGVFFAFLVFGVGSICNGSHAETLRAQRNAKSLRSRRFCVSLNFQTDPSPKLGWIACKADSIGSHLLDERPKGPVRRAHFDPCFVTLTQSPGLGCSYYLSERR